MDFGKLDNYSLEYSTLRVVNFILNSSASKDRSRAYTYIIKKLKENKVWPVLVNDIIKYANNDISSDLASEIILDKPTNDILESARVYFVQKSEPLVVNKILKFFDEYYRLGVFSEIISIIVKCASILKAGLNKEEFHQILIKFVFACVIKNQLDVALAEISKLKGNFDYYDLNIYIL